MGTLIGRNEGARRGCRDGGPTGGADGYGCPVTDRTTLGALTS